MSAKNRYINTHFWDDSYVIDLDPIEKLLFLYLITNPCTNICGAYEISLKRIAFDTGIDKEMVAKVLLRFENSGKIIYKEGWILLLNWVKHQNPSPTVQSGIKFNLKSCPDWIKECFIDENGMVSIQYRYPPPLNLTELNLIKEKEKRDFSSSSSSFSEENNTVIEKISSNISNIPSIENKKQNLTKKKKTKCPSPFPFEEAKRYKIVTDKMITKYKEAFLEYFTEGDGQLKKHVNWPLTFKNWVERGESWGKSGKEEITQRVVVDQFGDKCKFCESAPEVGRPCPIHKKGGQYYDENGQLRERYAKWVYQKEPIV
jgi:hypothetical protein